MRLLALPITVFSAMLLSVVPGAAAPVPTITVRASVNPNSSGPVVRSPVTVNFLGTIEVVIWPGNAKYDQIVVQYRWIGSGNFASPTQTVRGVPASAALLNYTYAWTINCPAGASGTNWLALQVTSPRISKNTSNPHATFMLTCPTTLNGKKVAGRLTIPTRPRRI